MTGEYQLAQKEHFPATDEGLVKFGQQQDFLKGRD